MIKLILFIVLGPVVVAVIYFGWKFCFEFLRKILQIGEVSMPTPEDVKWGNDSYYIFIEGLVFLLPGFNIIFLGLILFMDLFEIFIYIAVDLLYYKFNKKLPWKNQTGDWDM